MDLLLLPGFIFSVIHRTYPDLVEAAFLLVSGYLGDEELAGVHEAREDKVVLFRDVAEPAPFGIEYEYRLVVCSPYMFMVQGPLHR